jgi:hypothetical protein
METGQTSREDPDSYDGGRNTALVLRILRAIVIRARVDGRNTRPDIFAAVRSLNPKAKTPLATQGESIYS